MTTGDELSITKLNACPQNDFLPVDWGEFESKMLYSLAKTDCLYKKAAENGFKFNQDLWAAAAFDCIKLKRK